MGHSGDFVSGILWNISEKSGLSIGSSASIDFQVSVARYHLRHDRRILAMFVSPALWDQWRSTLRYGCVGASLDSICFKIFNTISSRTCRT
jgi:hypothetical protein